MSAERHDEIGTEPADAPPSEGAEVGPGRGRTHETSRSAGLYAAALIAVVLIGILVAWVIANRDSVEVNWLVGSTEAALALVIFVAAALGWIAGIATALAIRRRARSR